MLGAPLHALGALRVGGFFVAWWRLRQWSRWSVMWLDLGGGWWQFGRAVPVLAEATTIIAGASRMEFVRFFLVAAVANLGISIVQ